MSAVERFLRRAVEVEAVQISSPAAARMIQEWSGGVAVIDKPWKQYRESMDVTTPDGVVGAWPGCWVLRYPDGTYGVIESDEKLESEFVPIPTPPAAAPSATESHEQAPDRGTGTPGGSDGLLSDEELAGVAACLVEAAKAVRLETVGPTIAVKSVFAHLAAVTAQRDALAAQLADATRRRSIGGTPPSYTHNTGEQA